MIDHMIDDLFFFFNDTATTEIYTLSLHDALPISAGPGLRLCGRLVRHADDAHRRCAADRSEEHTSELQSRPHLVCRLLLEKKKEQLESDVGEPLHEALSLSLRLFDRRRMPGRRFV